MDQPNRDEEIKRRQEESLQEMLAEAGAYEEMVRTKGFAHLKAYITAEIQDLANLLLLQTDKPASDFEGKRHEIIGLNKLLGRIQGRLEALESYRKEESGKRAKKQA